MIYKVVEYEFIVEGDVSHIEFVEEFESEEEAQKWYDNWLDENPDVCWSNMRDGIKRINFWTGKEEII